MKFHIGSHAADEVLGAFEWFENQRAGLGTEFIEAVCAAYDRIEADPESFALHEYAHPDSQVRSIALKRFSYNVVYQVRRDIAEIRVIAVAHTSRRAAYWRGRI